MNSRIRELRKTLNLSQKDFAEKIGLKQNAISYMEKKGSTVTEQNIKTICSQFNVNENWLRTGQGEIFFEYDKKQKEFFAIFDSLSPVLQNYLIKTAKDLLDTQIQMQNNKELEIQTLSQTDTNTSIKDSKEQTATDDNNFEELSMTIEEAEAAYIKSRYNHVQKTVQSASNTFADTIKDPEKNINVKVSNQ
ncbi:helix-turn-helix transcriptional regulator [Lachnospiraceae bacterium 48-33]